jgi:hypothetical protein
MVLMQGVNAPIPGGHRLKDKCDTENIMYLCPLVLKDEGKFVPVF